MSDENENVLENGSSGKFPRSCLIMVMMTLFSPFLFHGIPELIDAITKVRIDNQYSIEYFDVIHEKCIYNGAQNFVCDPKIVYWNNDTLLVSDGEQCYLIELGKRIYNDQMEEIPCKNLAKILWQQPVEVWRKN